MLFRVDGAMAAICTLVLGRVKWDDRAELLNRGAAYGKCFAPPGYDSGQRHEVHRGAFHDYIVKRYAMRVAGCIAILLLWLSSVRSSPCEAAPHDARWSEGARRQLIGAWRLAAIEYSGPQGETVDPYYQA